MLSGFSLRICKQGNRWRSEEAEERGHNRYRQAKHAAQLDPEEGKTFTELFDVLKQAEASLAGWLSAAARSKLGEPHRK